MSCIYIYPLPSERETTVIKTLPNGFGSCERPLIRCWKSYYNYYTAIVTRKHIDQFVYGEPEQCRCIRKCNVKAPTGTPSPK